MLGDNTAATAADALRQDGWRLYQKITLDRFCYNHFAPLLKRLPTTGGMRYMRKASTAE